MRSANKSAEPLKQRARIFPANKNLDYENHNISRVLIVATKFPKEFGNASGRCKDVMPPAAAVNSNDGNTRKKQGGPWISIANHSFDLVQCRHMQQLAASNLEKPGYSRGESFWAAHGSAMSPRRAELR